MDKYSLIKKIGKQIILFRKETAFQIYVLNSKTVINMNFFSDKYELNVSPQVSTLIEQEKSYMFLSW